MSAMDKVRSFVEARTEDDELLPDGYPSCGDLRKVKCEYDRLQRLFVHCPDCGADYAATGLEVGCSCKLRAEVERLKLEKQEAEESEIRISKKLQLSHMNCACDYDHDGELCMAHFPAKEALDKKMAELRAEVERLQRDLGDCTTSHQKESARLENLMKDRDRLADDLTGAKQQLADQRAAMAGLVEALEGQRRRSNFTDQRCFCPDFHDTRRDGHTTECQKAIVELAAMKGELSELKSLDTDDGIWEMS